MQHEQREGEPPASRFAIEPTTEMNLFQNQIMKTSLCQVALCVVLLAASQCVSRSAEKPAREESLLVTVTASVEAIDLEKREVTLKGPLGNLTTFTVDPKVKRLKEFKVGDFVRADYYLSVAAELRRPTPEEEKTPFVLLEAAGKAPPGSSPAVGGLRRFKVVTTIEGLDRPARTITVKGPAGNFLTARVDDPSRFTQMRIGDNVVLVCTEALAISLEKAKKAD